MRNINFILLAGLLTSLQTLAAGGKTPANSVCKGKPADVSFQKLLKKQSSLDQRISEVMNSLPTDQAADSTSKSAVELTSAIQVSENSPLIFQLKSDDTAGIKGTLKSNSLTMKENISKIKYDYEPNNDHPFNLESSLFIDARSDFSILQRQVLDRKNGPNFFNTLNESDAAKKLTANVNNFFLLQILALEKETLNQSMKYLESHCDSESIVVDVVVENEVKKILGTYRTLRSFDGTGSDGDRAPASRERINASSRNR